MLGKHKPFFHEQIYHKVAAYRKRLWVAMMHMKDTLATVEIFIVGSDDGSNYLIFSVCGGGGRGWVKIIIYCYFGHVWKLNYFFRRL